MKTKLFLSAIALAVATPGLAEPAAHGDHDAPHASGQASAETQHHDMMQMAMKPEDCAKMHPGMKPEDCAKMHQDMTSKMQGHAMPEARSGDAHAGHHPGQ